MNILVYEGRGVADEGLKYLCNSLKRTVGEWYCINTISASQLGCDPWEANCSLLVITGGRGNCYVEDLSATIINRIRAFVLKRGAYLGLCAGAYFACDRIEFEREDPRVRVVGEYPLKFYPGLAIGTLFPGTFSYEGHRSSHAVRIVQPLANSELSDLPPPSWSGSRVYYNGGCHFLEDKSAGFEVTGKEDLEDRLTFSTLAEYENHSTAIVIGRNSQGRACVLLSGVHPEYDPIDLFQQNPTLDSVLNIDQTGRKALWVEILKILGLQVNSDPESCSKETPLVLMNPDLSLLDALTHKLQTAITNGTLETDIRVHSHDLQGSFNGLSSSDIIPIHAKAPKQVIQFDLEKYYGSRKHLSKGFGSYMLYGDIMSSTQTFLREHPNLVELLPQGTVVVAGKQLLGRGRGKSTWISSAGCLQFTLLLRHHLCSLSLPLIQCLTALAMIETILQKAPMTPVFIKWPNDIYVKDPAQEGSLRKIGGILVNSMTSIVDDSNILLIGFGINVGEDPNNPTLTSLLSIIASTGDGAWSRETLLAAFCSTFERMYKQSTLEGFPYESYYGRWLHSDQIVFLETEQVRVRIKGIDANGFLKAKVHDEGLLSLLNPAMSSRDTFLLEPDGNSFDLMQNLIKRKL